MANSQFSSPKEKMSTHTHSLGKIQEINETMECTMDQSLYERESELLKERMHTDLD